MNLRRYDTYIVHYDIGDFIEEYENINGEHTNANDALNIITVQKNRIAELESALCETCKDPRCEDSFVEYLKQKVARLEGENKKFREIVITKNARCPACDKWERAREFLGLPWKQYPDELKKIFEESAE